MNAFTAKEYTCFYARVLDADLPVAVDVVSRHGHARRWSCRATSTASAASSSKRSP